VRSREKPAPSQGPFASPTSGTAVTLPRTFEASVAWRTVVGSDGSVSMLHQLAQVDEITLDDDSADAGTPDMPCAQNQMCPSAGPHWPAYGAIASGCSAVVLSGVSTIKDGSVTAGPVLANATLAVDAAVSPDGQWLAIALAGNLQTVTTGDLTLPAIRFSAVVLPVGAARAPNAQCISPGTDAPGGTIVAGQVVAVAFDPSGRLVMQTRDPNRIRVLEHFTDCWTCTTFAPDIDMGGEARRDTGHDLFHSSVGVNLACASCHPGGGDDGHTWVFSGLGSRRTRPFETGIRDTLPLFWQGELATFDDLLAEVFVKRMGGHEPSLGEARAIESWIASLRVTTPMRPADDPAAVRGRALFESNDVGCAGCHSGQKLTNNQNEDVGTGGTFQVPALRGVAYHGPWMHNGCADSLRKRFDHSCGGATHGNTATLSDAQIDDLAAYLESL
jgi:mono/diheme cytochrome c family protein